MQIEEHRTSNRRSSGKRFAFIACGVIVAVAAAIYLAFSLAVDTIKRDEEAKLRNGQTITVSHVIKKKPFYGGHVFGSGGGMISHEIRFTIDGKPYYWKELYRPIVLQPCGGRAYLIVFDNETDFQKWRYRFYCLESPDQWREIMSDEFPKGLAIQNLSLSHQNGLKGDGSGPIDEYEIVSKLDPNDGYFRSSHTAKLWVRLKIGTAYYAFEESQASPEFLNSYRETYIDSPPECP